MHTLLIHQAFTAIDEPGGTRHYELARYLSDRGHRVTVIASPISYLTGTTHSPTFEQVGFDQPGKTADITVLRTYTYPALHRSFVHRIFSFLSFMISSFIAGLRVKDIDLVWGTSPPIFQGVTAWTLAKIRRVPFLFEVRDLWPAFAVAVGVLRSTPLIKASEWLERFLYARADLVIVNSPGFISYVKSHGARRVELVPNGADPEMFSPDQSGVEFRQAYDLEGKFIAMYAGAHGMSNDLDTLLDAAAHLVAQPSIAIVFVGDGKEKLALVKRAQDLSLTNVVFTPPIPKYQMRAALAAADACIAILKPIELYKAVYPNKVFDYMAAGRPVILAIDGVIRELVEQSEAGVFVPPGDAQALSSTIYALASNPEMRRDMGEKGRRFVETQFNRAEMAARLASLIENLSSSA